MTDTETRLVELLDEHLNEVHPAWRLEDLRGHRIESPVEPCNVCGHRVFLMLPAGCDRPVWLQFGDVVDTDTLFPACKTKRHTCGDGDSWSVEAALFAETAMSTWNTTPNGATL